MEQTGRENMMLAGKLYGKSKEEAEALLPEMIDFADIGEYIDRPVRTYSSGMRARLAFSLVSFVDPEILIIDEVLGVGDAAFNQKSQTKVLELCNKGKILLIVSHSMNTIRAFTDRCIWLDSGKIRMDGKTAPVTDAYTQFMRKKEETRIRKDLAARMHRRYCSDVLEISSFSLGGTRENQMIFDVYDDIYIRVMVSGLQSCAAFDLEMTILNMNGAVIMHNSLYEDSGDTLSILAGQRMEIGALFQKSPLSEGNYEIVVKLMNGEIMLAEGIAALVVENHKIKVLSLPGLYCENNISARYL
jgi:lipopolysaccharide transport system ATP-binding protein